MPLSYLSPNYREPSAPAGSNVSGAEPGLARAVLNPTGGRRNRRTRSNRCFCRRSRKSRNGGFYPSVMGNFVGNASRLVPAIAITGYRMVRNFKKTRKSRK